MFRRFRDIERGEFFVVFGDTAQGGEDSNFVVFMSKTKADVPLVFQMHGVAAAMTPFLREALEKIYDTTGVKPVVCLERNNGGASAMHDLITTNQDNKYRIYYMLDEHGEKTEKPGWDTNAVSRAQMLGEWLVAFNAGLIKVFDEITIDQHSTFIVNKNGKPEAAGGTHDDAVIACAGAYQLFLSQNPPAPIKKSPRRNKPTYRRNQFMVNGG